MIHIFDDFSWTFHQKTWIFFEGHFSWFCCSFERLRFSTVKSFGPCKCELFPCHFGLPCSQAGLDAFSPFLAIFSAYNALIGSGVVWNDKTRRGKSFFGHIWWNFSFLGRKTLKNHQKMSQNDVFLGSTLQKKACFLQSRFNFLQNVLERWYGHGRKCVTLLRSWISWFWKSRADLSICARARALEIRWNVQKMGRKS